MPERKMIVLISCVSKKRSYKARAEDLYISPLFRLNLRYAKTKKPDDIFILSAKYGLLKLDEEIEPYNVTLNQMNVSERKSWAIKVVNQLKNHCNLQYDHFVFLAGEKYRQYLVQHLASYEMPLARLPIGKQLQYLKGQVTNESCL